MNEDVNIRLKARDEATTAFRKAGAACQSFAKTVGSAMIGLKGLLGGLALRATLGKALAAWTEQEQAAREMDQALRSLNDTSEESRRRAQEFASSIQAVSVHGDEAVLRLQALGANMGKLTGEQLERATKAALGLSRAFKMDASAAHGGAGVAAMRLVARAAQGQTQTLARYGIVLNDNLTPQQKFNQLLLIGEKYFTEMTKGVKTYGEEMTMLKNQIGDTFENLGAILTGLGKDESGYKWIRNMTSGFADLNDKLNSFIALKEKNIALDQKLAGIKAPSEQKKIGLGSLPGFISPQFHWMWKKITQQAEKAVDTYGRGYQDRFNEKQNMAARLDINQFRTDKAIERNKSLDLKPMALPGLPLNFLKTLPGIIQNGLKTSMTFIQKQVELGKGLPRTTPGLPGFQPNLEFQESRFLTLGRGNRNKTEENTAIMAREARQQTRLLASLDRKAGRSTTATTTPELLEAKLA